MLLLFLAYTAEATTFSRLASYFPLFAGLSGLILSAVNLRKEVRRPSVEGGSEGPQDEPGAQGTESAAAAANETARYLGWIVAYIVLIAVVGFIVATAIFLAASLKILGHASWRGVAVGVASVIAFVYAVSHFMNLVWPDGLFV